MRYAKIENGNLKIAPRTIALGDKVIVNPTPETLLSAGYLPVKTAEMPPEEPGYYWASSWMEQDEQIVQTWSKEPLPPEPETLEQRVTDLEYIINGVVTE